MKAQARCKFDNKILSPSRQNQKKVFCNDTCRGRYHRKQKEQDKMKQFESEGLKIFTADSVAPLRATLHKTGKLALSDSAVTALGIDRARGVLFATDKEARLIMIVARVDAPGLFPVTNARFISSQHFFNSVGASLAEGARRFELKMRDKPDEWELVPLRTKPIPAELPSA